MAEQAAPGTPVPPGQLLHRQNVPDVTILEVCRLLKACNFQGKAWGVNCSQLLVQKQLPIPHPRAQQAAVHVSLEHLAGPRVGKKDPVLQKLGICSE